MNVPCPSCGAEVEQASPPVRGPTTDGSQAWTCLKCPAVVCCWCYHDHTAAQHPDMYGKRPTVGGKKGGRGKRR